MTSIQRKLIIGMREKGCSYNQIADALNVSINSVKSFCQRNLLGGVQAVNQLPKKWCCKQCGKEIPQTVGKRAKQYCSDACRMAWWNAHPAAPNRKSARTFICLTCEQSFASSDKRERKYCSLSCYGKSKVGKP